MTHVVEQMLEKYQCKTPDDRKNALKEIVQEIALLGLSRSGFFDHAAFYGGTALRLFYGLERFSEDLDFSLLHSDPEFTIDDYCDAIQNELGANGFEMDVTKKEKSVKSAIESAFIKGRTLIQLLNINAAVPPVSGVHKNEVLKIKLEVDTNPPDGAEYEIKYSLRPIPYSVRLFSAPSLFAGKLHAVLCRNWKGERVKGRDLYDFVWYITKEFPVNLIHLEKRMKQTGHLEQGSILTGNRLLDCLEEKFSLIDYQQAKNDTIPFLKDPAAVEIWSADFFKAISKRIVMC